MKIKSQIKQLLAELNEGVYEKQEVTALSLLSRIVNKLFANCHCRISAQIREIGDLYHNAILNKKFIAMAPNKFMSP